MSINQQYCNGIIHELHANNNVVCYEIGLQLFHLLVYLDKNMTLLVKSWSLRGQRGCNSERCVALPSCCSVLYCQHIGTHLEVGILLNFIFMGMTGFLRLSVAPPKVCLGRRATFPPLPLELDIFCDPVCLCQCLVIWQKDLDKSVPSFVWALAS